jgi:hypothetical protein
MDGSGGDLSIARRRLIAMSARLNTLSRSSTRHMANATGIMVARQAGIQANGDLLGHDVADVV